MDSEPPRSTVTRINQAPIRKAGRTSSDPTGLLSLYGLLLSVYGALILGSGIYNMVSPPAHPVVLAHLHADIWWGILLLVVGLIYVIKYWPSKR